MASRNRLPWAVKVALPSGSFAVGAVIAIAVRATLTVVELIYVGVVTLLGRKEAEAEAQAEAEGTGITAAPGSPGAGR